MAQGNQSDVPEMPAVGAADRREDLQVGAPAPEPAQQPGFKVLEEEPRRSVSKGVWTVIALAVAILVVYLLGYLR